MNRPSTILLAAAVLASLGPAAAPRAEGGARLLRVAGRGTGEVASFLKRRSACNRLRDADGGDPDRAAEAVRARFGFRCSTLADEESRLRARYDDRPEVIESLDQDGGLDLGGE